MAAAEPGAGDVHFRLDGEAMVLKPSVEACRTISKLAGDSLAQAIARCNRLDFDFIVEVIALGLGATSPKLRKEVEGKVYHSGVMSVAADCIMFIRVIMNGGQIPRDNATAESISLLDQLQRSLPEDVDSDSLDAMRAALVAKLQEEGAGDEEPQDPLPGSASPSENSIGA